MTPLACDLSNMFPKNCLHIVTVATLLRFSNAFWRMPCLEMALGRMDPIISPGIVSSHVHTVVGADSKFSLVTLQAV